VANRRLRKQEENIHLGYKMRSIKSAISLAEMDLIKSLSASPGLLAFQEALRQGNSLLIEDLWDSAKALLAVLACRSTGQSILLITGGMREDRLFDNITQLDPDLPLEFPSWETLPGEEIAPSPDIIGKRMEALHALTSKKGPSIVLCPIASFLQKVPSAEQLTSLLSIWKKGSSIPFNAIPILATREPPSSQTKENLPSEAVSWIFSPWPLKTPIESISLAMRLTKFEHLIRSVKNRSKKSIPFFFRLQTN
jgi:hypothetical protein